MPRQNVRALAADNDDVDVVGTVAVSLIFTTDTSIRGAATIPCFVFVLRERCSALRARDSGDD